MTRDLKRKSAKPSGHGSKVSFDFDSFSNDERTIIKKLRAAREDDNSIERSQVDETIDPNDHTNTTSRKPLMGEELRMLKDAGDLYQSSSFKLQVCSFFFSKKVEFAVQQLLYRSMHFFRMFALI